MLIDIHTHTWRGSEDSSLRPADLIARAKELGLDGVCFTDHEWFWTPEELEKLRREQDFLVLPGVEISTEEGHFLAFGLQKYVFGMHRGPFLREQVEKADGALVLAHPYRRQFHIEVAADEEKYNLALEKACDNPAFRLAHAVEVINGRGKKEENGFSHRICHRLGLKGTAGSDSHAASDLGTCATFFERNISSLQDLIQELRAGRFRPANLRHGR